MCGIKDWADSLVNAMELEKFIFIHHPDAIDVCGSSVSEPNVHLYKHEHLEALANALGEEIQRVERVVGDTPVVFPYEDSVTYRGYKFFVLVPEQEQ